MIEFVGVFGHNLEAFKLKDPKRYRLLCKVVIRRRPAGMTTIVEFAACDFAEIMGEPKPRGGCGCGKS